MSPDLLGVSIVIPARNSAATLGECLEGVRQLEYPADRLEVVVVDNGSTDGTPEVARRCGFEPVECPRTGASAARNDGVSQARHGVIAFLDSDAIPKPDWLRRLVEPFDDPQVGGVGGKISPVYTITGPEYHAVVTHVLDQEAFLAGKPPFQLPFAATANAAYRASVVREVGGFDESLAVCEDADLAWRVQWAGHCLRYVAEAEVRHYNRPTRGPYFRQVYQYGQGTARLFAKHRRRLGRSVWIDWKHFGLILRSAVRVPIAPLVGKNRWERVAPLYDLAAALLWSAGRIRESIRRRVVVI